MNKLYLIIILALPMLNIFGKNSQCEKFWSWFQKNENRIFNFERHQNVIFNEIKKQLNKIDSNLVFEFSNIQNGKREFIISADGIKKSFTSVEKLFDAAPNFQRWEIIKFRPRRPILYGIEYQGLKIHPDEIAFELIPDNNKIDIALYIKNYDESKRNIYGSVAFIFLDSSLGEYDVEMKVGKINIKSSKEIMNFDENNIKYLAKRFDEVYSKIN